MPEYSATKAKPFSHYEKKMRAYITEKTKIVLVPPRDKDHPRNKELHPSSYPFCALKQAWYEANGIEEKQLDYYGDFYTSVGTITHELMQKYLGYRGKIIGEWKCVKCKTIHKKNRKPIVAPKKCKKCKHTVFDYEELGISFRKYTRGHMDGIIEIDGKYFVIDYKGLPLDTKIPTPSGWTTMGELKVGDKIFGSDGKVCKVKHKSKVHKRKCYKVIFDDGSTVTCDDEHLWSTVYGRERKKLVLNTEQIKETLIQYGQKAHRIELPKPIDLKEKKFVIDPYVLGCWLGDGTVDRGSITKPDKELFFNIECCGYNVEDNFEDRAGFCPQHNIEGLREQLKKEGLLNNKHIPQKYMRGSFEQRLELLRGIMDTDGSWNKARKRAVMNTVDKTFAEQVKELALTLGLRPTISPYIAKGFGKEVQAYFVEFTCINGINPFKLSRKANLVIDRTWNTTTQRVIVSVEEVPAVKTQCIAVDSKDKTYLCTENFIPTHNTTSPAKNEKHRKFKNVYPYKKNKAQIESYTVYVEQEYDIKISGWMLIYVSRDNNFKDYVIVGDTVSEKRKAELLKKYTRDDKLFGIVLKLRKGYDWERWSKLIKYKPCATNAEYKEKMHEYDMCELAKDGTCFNKKRLQNAVKNLNRKIKVVNKL